MRLEIINTFQPLIYKNQQVIDDQCPLRLWCQDERRLGLNTITRRLLTLPGVKPIGPIQWQFKAFYLYGVVEPLTGESFFLEFSHLDSECFQVFLDQFSQTYTDSLNVLQLDNGSFHLAHNLRIPDNVTLLLQPPYSPDVNPIERVWQHIKDQLSWLNFKTLDELRQRVDESLHSLTSERVASLTSYDFILSALEQLHHTNYNRKVQNL